MRDIKFRLIYKDEIVGYEWHDDSDGVINIWQKVPGGVWFNMRYFPDKHIIHDHKDQFTGLNKCKNVDAYENDIITNGNTKSAIWWDAANAGFYCFNSHPVNDLNIVGYEIIGNTHENPELLD